MTERRIEYLPIDEIQPDPRNPRAHESIEDVKASILRFGFVDPIIHDDRTGQMIAGHGRVEALTDLHARWLKAPKKDREVPGGITADGDRWHAPVIVGWSSADDDEAAGLLIALNRLTETSKWIPDKQLALLNEIAKSVEGLVGVGYTDEDRAALQRLVEASGEALDAAAEWAAAGMPEYSSEDLQGAYRTVVHFRTMEDADRFFVEVMGGRDRISYVWWPEPDGHRGMNIGRQWVHDENGQPRQQEEEQVGG
jgi:hypothetical protein